MDNHQVTRRHDYAANHNGESDPAEDFKKKTERWTGGNELDWQLNGHCEFDRQIEINRSLLEIFDKGESVAVLLGNTSAHHIGTCSNQSSVA